MRLRRTWAACATVATLTLSGCGLLTGGVYDAPLPGGADVGDNPIRLSAEFDDVLALVPQSSVKVDNVDVGKVTEIDLAEDGKRAVVELEVHGGLDLPENTTARLQQTSLLGEKYVALHKPESPGSGDVLDDGDQLLPTDDDAAATVEQVLGGLSMVLNGGGVGQFQDISRELQQIGGGRTGEITKFLKEFERFVKVLDNRRDAITGALDGLNNLGKALDNDRDKIADVLADLSPGLAAMEAQRPQFVKMLEELDHLSNITVETLNASQKDIVADLKLLRPILRQLANSGSDLPAALEILLTYPFPDSVLSAIKGDYLNVFITTNFRTLPNGCTASDCLWLQPGSSGDAAQRSGSARRGAAPPSLLPPTSSATPGSPSPSVPGPTLSEGPTSSAGDPSDDASSNEPGSPGSPTSPSSPTDDGSPTQSPSSSDDPSSTAGATRSPSGSGSAGHEGGE